MSLLGVQPPRRTTSTDQAYEAILAAILDGAVLPGAALPLQELATSLGMSMMPVREAIRQLEATGIIEIEPHRGARVRPVSPEDLEDTYIARIELEGVLVQRAAERFDDDHAQMARAILRDHRLASERGDLISARELHRLFHHTIYEAAGSTWLLRSIRATWQNSERYRSPGMSAPATADSRRVEHSEILEACIERDPLRARDALAAHLISTVRGLDPAIADRLDRMFASRS